MSFTTPRAVYGKKNGHRSRITPKESLFPKDSDTKSSLESQSSSFLNNNSISQLSSSSLPKNTEIDDIFDIDNAVHVPTKSLKDYSKAASSYSSQKRSTPLSRKSADPQDNIQFENTDLDESPLKKKSLSSLKQRKSDIPKFQSNLSKKENEEKKFDDSIFDLPDLEPVESIKAKIDMKKVQSRREKAQTKKANHLKALKPTESSVSSLTSPNSETTSPSKNIHSTPNRLTKSIPSTSSTKKKFGSLSLSSDPTPFDISRSRDLQNSNKNNSFNVSSTNDIQSYSKSTSRSPIKAKISSSMNSIKEPSNSNDSLKKIPNSNKNSTAQKSHKALSKSKDTSQPILEKPSQSKKVSPESPSRLSLKRVKSNSLRQTTLGDSFFIQKAPSDNKAISSSTRSFETKSTNNSNNFSSENEIWSFLDENDDDEKNESPRKKKRLDNDQLQLVGHVSDSDDDYSVKNHFFNDPSEQLNDTQETEQSESQEAGSLSGSGSSFNNLAAINQKQWSAIRAASYGSVRKYGSDRSFAVESAPAKAPSGNTKNSNLALLEQFGAAEENESDSGEVEDDDFGGNLKTVYELRALGGNTQFSDEIQYILEGIDNGISSRRSSLLELTEKCLDETFAADFRMSTIFNTFFESMKDEKDVICTFLIAVLICTLLSGNEQHSGLAVAFIHSYGIIDMFADMMSDTEDISRVVSYREINATKVFQSLFKEGLAKFQRIFLQLRKTKREKNFDSQKLIFSRSLVSLTGFVLLQRQGERIDIMYTDYLIKKDYLTKFLEQGEIFQKSVLPFDARPECLPEFHIDFSDESEKSQIDKESYYELITNIHLLHLSALQIEYIAQTNFDAMVTCLENNLSQGKNKNFAFRLLSFIPEIGEFWKNGPQRYNPQIVRAVRDIAVVTLKLFILITSNVVYSEVSENIHSRKGRFYHEIYTTDLSLSVLTTLKHFYDHIYESSDHKSSASSEKFDSLPVQERNVILFSWGLLVNLCESKQVAKSLLEPAPLSIFKSFLEYADLADLYDDIKLHSISAEESKDDSQEETQDDNAMLTQDPSAVVKPIDYKKSNSHSFHCQGYQLLVIGLIISVVGNEGMQKLSSTEQEKIKKGLYVFKESLSSSWALQFKDQVSRVLQTIESL